MKVHRESKHPTSTFSICFPGFFNPDEAVIAAQAAAVAVPTKSSGDASVVAAPVVEKPKKEKKPKADLSFLDSAISTKKK
jgi:hypothetical protein